MRITVFGTGYVGLVQAAVFAEAGHDVVCVDIDAAKIERLRHGEMPIFEPGLAPMVERNAAAGRLAFTAEAGEALARANVFMIAVGTPPAADGSADLSHVRSVAEAIGRGIARDALVVVKSTVPVGTCDAVQGWIDAALRERGVVHRVSVASNPEFLKEGSAVADCAKPDRIVVGVRDPLAEDMLREMYAPFNRNREKMIVMDVRSSELTKYAANCMLATRISFMNEMALLADKVGADIESVRLGVGSDPRIGYDFLYAGLGYGGSCFPKDVGALIRAERDWGVEPLMLEAVDGRNARQKRALFEKIVAVFGSDLSGRTFALWGLAFKGNTDDVRESSALVILEALWAAGARVRAFDPEAMPATRRRYGARDDLTLCASREEALEGADALVVATDWREFKVPPFDLIRERLRHPIVFDGRNLYDPGVVARYGLEYQGIGRRSAPLNGARSVAQSPEAA